MLCKLAPSDANYFTHRDCWKRTLEGIGRGMEINAPRNFVKSPSIMMLTYSSVKELLAPTLKKKK